MLVVDGRVGVIPEVAGVPDVGAGDVIPEGVAVAMVVAEGDIFAVDVVSFGLLSFTAFSNQSSFFSFLDGAVTVGAGTKSARAMGGWAVVVTSCAKPVTPHPSHMVVSSLHSGHGIACGTPGRAGQYAKDASGMLHTAHIASSSRQRFAGAP